MAPVNAMYARQPPETPDRCVRRSGTRVACRPARFWTYAVPATGLRMGATSQTILRIRGTYVISRHICSRASVSRQAPTGCPASLATCLTTPCAALMPDTTGRSALPVTAQEAARNRLPFVTLTHNPIAPAVICRLSRPTPICSFGITGLECMGPERVSFRADNR